MTTSVLSEISELEEQLRQADLNPNPDTFRKLLDENFVLMTDGKLCSPKEHIVEMHKPEKAQKFDRIEMSEMEIKEHGGTATVTCVGTYEGTAGKFKMNFLRVWAKKPDGWKIIAGAMTVLNNEKND